MDDETSTPRERRSKRREEGAAARTRRALDLDAVQDALQAVGDGERERRRSTRRAEGGSDLAFERRRSNARSDPVEKLAADETRSLAAFAAHRELVAGVAHDLRTPLTALHALAEAIRDEVTDAEARARYLRQLSTQLGMLDAMVDDLFELSRLQAGDVEWRTERLRMPALVDEVVEAMRPQAERKGIGLAATLPLDLPPANGNPEKVQRVLFNLVDNAIRHTPEEGRVTIASEVAGRVLETEVADTGEGVDPALRHRVFEPFFQGGRGTVGGGGLGLAICRAIVEAHGERIWLAGAGPGTRVRFSLRRA